uniref:Uncharacterized protein n=1 Tax=Molossus molossus TaxID=27622 RepID=A0A7J8JX80_MOLMO|nr:hypothetical protein HJG59_008061 [Molossus molossus]
MRRILLSAQTRSPRSCASAHQNAAAPVNHQAVESTQPSAWSRNGLAQCFPSVVDRDSDTGCSPPVSTLDFVQDKQKTSLTSKLGLLNTSEAERWAGCPVRAGPTRQVLRPQDRGLACPRGYEEPAGLTAGLAFQETGRKELSPLWALEEGSAAINREPREGGS